MKRTVLCLLALVLVFTATAGLASAQVTPTFKLGFKALADQVPEVAGQPLENEHWGDNGDSLQQTSTGLMAWRKADNWTAFTDGSRSWVNGPFGVMERANEERFEWEGDRPAAPISTVSPTDPSGGVQSPTPAGAYVTSSFRTAKNYYAASDSRWQGLSPEYRVWFNSVAELLARFPDRVPAS